MILPEGREAVRLPLQEGGSESMDIISSGQLRVALLLSMLIALWGVESILPLFPPKGSRLQHALPNLGLTVILILMNLLFAGVTARGAAWSLDHRIGVFFIAGISGWAAFGLGMLALDAFGYFAHVAMHQCETGWRIHRVHHSEPQVDVTTAFRQHPAETLIRIGFQVAAIVLFGIPIWVAVLYLAVSAMNAQLEHANFRVPEKLDRILRAVIVTPNMHKLHHSREKRETNSNYSNIFSIWDRIFGTYCSSAKLEGLRYGLDGFDDENGQTLKGLLRLPFND